jgi:hypothetical protein
MQKPRFQQPKYQHESWVTANIAARLTGHTVKEVVDAVAANPDTITEKIAVIGQKKFHLIARADIIAHFLTVDAAAAATKETATCAS